MKLPFFFQLLLAFLFAATVTAQSGSLAATPVPTVDADWFVEKLSEGDHVPNQLIAYYENAGNASAIKRQQNMINKGINVTVEQLSSNSVLVSYLDGLGVLPDCAGLTDEECICEIVGNPGSNSGTEADGLWPNYITSTGMPEVIKPNPVDPVIVVNPFPNNQYDPLINCDSEVTIPEARIQGEVNIAILDSGIETTKHGRFFNYSDSESGQGRTIVEWHQVGDERDYRNTDVLGHGTAVAYLTAHSFVKRNKQDKIRLHSYRVLNERGRGTAAQAIKAISQAIDDGVDVINMSFGFKGIDCDFGVEELLKQQLARANANQIMVFVSAGNDGNPLATKPQWPAAENEATRVFTVGASTCGAYRRWDNSNHGRRHVDYMAPGTRIFVPFVPGGQDFSFINVDGTSFATPIAAGWAANLISAYGRNSEAVLCLVAGFGAYYEPHNKPTQQSPLGSEDATFATISTTQHFCLANGDIEVDDDIKPDPDLGGGVIINPRSSASPNPFRGSLVVTVPLTKDNNEAVIAIYSATGNLVKQLKTRTASTTINTDDLDSGIYYVKIGTAEGQQALQMIKL